MCFACFLLSWGQFLVCVVFGHPWWLTVTFSDFRHVVYTLYDCGMNVYCNPAFGCQITINVYVCMYVFICCENICPFVCHTRPSCLTDASSVFRRTFAILSFGVHPEGAHLLETPLWTPRIWPIGYPAVSWKWHEIMCKSLLFGSNYDSWPQICIFLRIFPENWPATSFHYLTCVVTSATAELSCVFAYRAPLLWCYSVFRNSKKYTLFNWWGAITTKCVSEACRLEKDSRVSGTSVL